MNYETNIYQLLNSIWSYKRYEKLTSLEKLILIHLTSLNKTGDTYCWGTNQYFCDIYKVSRQTISKSINDLVNIGYLRSKYDKFNRKNQKRRIFLSDEFNAQINGIKYKFNTGNKTK